MLGIRRFGVIKGAQNLWDYLAGGSRNCFARSRHSAKSFVIMQVWAKILLIVLFPLFVFVVGATQINTDDYLKNYESPSARLRAGFIPAEQEFVMGEPLEVTFTAENTGQTNFEFWFGGDYRGTGRHDRFKIVATNTGGETLPDPIARPMSFGGISQLINLKPGQLFTNVIQLTDFRVIDSPGTYTIGCSFAFGEQWLRDETNNPVVNTVFKLVILPRTPERVASVLDRLAARARVSRGGDLDDTMALIVRFGREDAFSRLKHFIKQGPIELRIAAIQTLPLIPTDASLRVALDNLKDTDPNVRSAAAGALGAMGKPRGIDALLKALPGENPKVSGNILRALGVSKSAQGFPVITNALDVDGTEMQRAAIDAMVNFGGSNAVAVLRQHINTNFLAIRYDIVLALAEELGQPMQAQWLLPVLAGREMNQPWLDSLRLFRLYGGTNAIPTMLSCLDFDVAWSGRNWWILNQGVKYCSGAPAFTYVYEADLNGDNPYYPDGTPEMWTNDLRTLQKLKALAGPIPATTPLARRPIVAYLKTDPAIDFTPSFTNLNDGGVQIQSGFLTAEIHAGYMHEDYSPSPPYQAIYGMAARLRALPNASSEKLKQLNISSEQMNRLTAALKNFATKLCGSGVSDQAISNFYNSLVYNPDYCCGDFFDDFRRYREAPGELRACAKNDLIDGVRIFSQNYHAGTVELVENAKMIFTRDQLGRI